MLSRKTFDLTQKIYQTDNFFLTSSNFFIKYTFEIALQYLFNVFILYNTIFYLKLNFKLKIDPKMCTFKSLEEILKNCKKFWKNEWQPWVFDLLKKGLPFTPSSEARTLYLSQISLKNQVLSRKLRFSQTCF